MQGAEAMIEAGRVRLRPILMTAFSTIAGILPIAIGFGAGAESRRPWVSRGRRNAHEHIPDAGSDSSGLIAC